MPVMHAIWKVGETPQSLPKGRLASEEELERMITSTPEILSPEWMLIGRQVQTSYGGRVDILALAPDASVVLIELKKNRTPRDIVAQALDYASWVEQLQADDIARIFHKFSGGQNLSDAFRKHFRIPLEEGSLNESHQIILVAAELDDSTERIINYLSARDIAINVVFFQVFEYGTEQLLSRAWLIDPGETQSNAAATPKAREEKEPWNGEFYVSYGPLDLRSWDTARQYGFISAGGGSWYSQTLKRLKPGDRVWVNIPKTGYVGVGLVANSVLPFHEFKVKTTQGERPVQEILKNSEAYNLDINDTDKMEYFVRVDWLDTVPEDKAVLEVGLFGNQNTVCQPTTPKWRHTIDRLKPRFRNWDRQ